MADAYSIPPVNPQRAGGATTSVLDRHVSINGTISSEGAIRIEGKVTGDVEARTVTLAPDATIEGRVKADVAIIEGRLTGPLHAREVRLTSVAHMEGEVVHSILIVEAGAHFDGECRRDGSPRRDASAPPAPPPSTPAAANEKAPEEEKAAKDKKSA